jgi:DNA-binding response OmpR family regulator
MNPTASVLIVDDEPDLLENIGLALEGENYRILTASNGVEALQILQSRPVDLILADIAMPDMNGYQLYERVRQNMDWISIPFIFLTARTMDSDIRYGKELGVDDYLAKPIRAADLLAVVRGKLRRAQQLAAAAPPDLPPAVETGGVTVAGLRIDPSQYRAWLGQEELKLSAKEFILLEYLAQQAGKVIPPQELVKITHQFETDHIEAGTLLRPLILSLRRKLDDRIVTIENVRGVGYRLVVPH